MIDKPNIFKYIWYLHFSSYNAKIFLLARPLQNKLSVYFWLLLQCLPWLFPRIMHFRWDGGHRSVLVMLYIRYRLMSGVRKYAQVHFLSFFSFFFFVSALAALLLSSWLIDSLSWVLSEKHDEGMIQKHLWLLQHTPESQHQTPHKGRRSIHLVYVTWYFGFSLWSYEELLRE